jgi:hypothetical protein
MHRANRASADIIKATSTKNTSNYPIVLTNVSALNSYAKQSLRNVAPSKIYV